MHYVDAPSICARCTHDLVARAVLLPPEREGDCEQCGGAMTLPAARWQGGGRQKRFCSGKCRTESHRHAKRQR